MKKPLIIVGNWKMNLFADEALVLARGITKFVKPLSDIRVVLAPSFTFLFEIRNILLGTNVELACQNFYFEENGAYTGEISVGMIKDAGCNFAILGHSERRHLFGETDDLINKNEKLYAQQKFSNEDCFKSLLILYKWIDAMTYQDMSEHFDAEPGDIFYIKENAKDLVYTFTEIIKFWRDHAKENEQKKIVSEYQNLIDESDLLRLQVVHGVPEKYLELVKIKQIGRVRAQILYKNGYKNWN